MSDTTSSLVNTLLAAGLTVYVVDKVAGKTVKKKVVKSNKKSRRKSNEKGKKRKAKKSVQRQSKLKFIQGQQSSKEKDIQLGGIICKHIV